MTRADFMVRFWGGVLIFCGLQFLLIFAAMVDYLIGGW